MVLSGILNGIVSILDFLFGLLPSFSIDDTKLSTSWEIIIEYVEKANKIFPVDTLMTVIGIFCAFAVAMFAYWSAMRVINLIRGAG